MRDELKGPKVENVGVAVIESINELNEKEYNVYLLNLRDDIMEGIIITSNGYGENPNTGDRVKNVYAASQFRGLVTQRGSQDRTNYGRGIRSFQ